MYKKAKKILALILTLSMVFSMLPLSYANEIEAQVGEETLAEEIQNTENIENTENTEVEEEDQVLELTGEGGEEAALEEPNLEEHQEKANEAEEELAEPEFGAGADGNIGGVEIPEGASFLGLLFRNSERGEEIQPGDLSVNKSAEPSSEEKVWDIELTLTGRDVVQTTDIVLVMDTSGSMNEAGRMASAKEAAKGFVDKMIKEDGNTQIAIVKFSDGAAIACNLTTNKDDLNRAIEKLKAYGGTHTQAGIYQAELILKNSNADNRVIVLLSDGYPTYSYDVLEGYEKYTKEFKKNKFETRADLPYSLVNVGKSMGGGDSIRTRKPWSFKYYVNHGNMAIVEANEAKKKAAIYAIGLSLDTTGKEVMQAIGGGNYYDAESSNLNEVYNKIGGKIAYAAKNAKVTDPIGEMFDIVNSSEIQVVDKNGDKVTGAKVEWKKADNENPSGHFTVTIPAVTEALSPIKIKYQVKIKEDEAVPGKLYKTNGTTTIEYTNSSGEIDTEYFTVPEVGLNAASIRIYELYVDEAGKILKASDDDNFGKPAINQYDNPISSDFFLDNGSNALKFGKEYTVTADPTVTKTIKGEDKNFVLSDAFTVVKGSNDVEVNVSKSPYKKTFAQSESVELFYVYRLQKNADYTVKHILQKAEGGYDYQGAKTEIKQGAIGAFTEATARTGEHYGIDYDYYIPQDFEQQTIKGDGSTVVEIKYNRRTVTFTAKSDTVVYNGEEQTVSGCTHDAVNVEFENISASGKGTEVGEYDVIFTNNSPTVQDKNNKKYFAKYEKGKLIITPAEAGELNLQITNYNGVYDGEEHALVATAIDGAKIEYFVNNEWTETVPTIKNAGKATYRVRATQPNYSTAEKEGTLEVTKKSATITAGSKTKPYDGTALTDNTYKVEGFVHDEGVESAVIKGSITNVGTEKNVVESFKLKDNTSKDNYNITKVDGTLTITQASGSGGSGGSGGSDGGSGGSDYAEFKPEEDATIEEDKTPLGKLNTEDHFAYLTGYSDGTVKAKNYLTREEVAAVFFRLLDKQYREEIRSTESNFSDVNASRWSNKHISTLAKSKIISGYTDGTFKPGMKITRAELAAIASRFDKLEANEDHKFSDIKGHWAEKYIASAVKKGWVSGYEDGSFKPDQHITRAEFVVFVNNVLNRHVKIEDILAGAKEFGDLKDKSSWYYCPMKAATNSYLFKEEIEDKAHSLKYQKWTELISAAIEM